MNEEIEEYPRFTILDKDHNLVPAELMEWARFIEKNENKIVKQETLPGTKVLVSTVFLGMDHGFGRMPLYFETMIFGGPLDKDQSRCTTWKEAEEMHQEMLKKAMAAEVGVFEAE